MKREIEARYYPIDKDQVLEMIKGIFCIDNFKQYVIKRYILSISEGKFLRVRSEAGTVTAAIKHRRGSEMWEQQVVMSNCTLEGALAFFGELGIVHDSYQESERIEIRNLVGDFILTIDMWPGLEPLLEVEVQNECDIISIEQLLRVDHLRFHGSISELYQKIHGIDKEKFNTLPQLTFENWRSILRNEENSL